jgi:hypothetical protein
MCDAIVSIEMFPSINDIIECVSKYSKHEMLISSWRFYRQMNSSHVLVLTSGIEAANVSPEWY